MKGSKAGGEKWVVVCRGAKKEVMQEDKQGMVGSSDSRFHVLQEGEEACAEIAGNEKDDGDKNFINSRETELCPEVDMSREKEEVGISGDYDHRDLERERPK
ncbi:hypothetical protein Dimus_016781 [Dionaea muscipula]